MNPKDPRRLLVAVPILQGLLASGDEHYDGLVDMALDLTDELLAKIDAQATGAGKTLCEVFANE